MGITKHGHTQHGRQSPEYKSWHAMMQRCRNQNDDNWRHYGGRGISVCDRWSSFECFLADMGARPSLGHSLDRFPDPNGNYEPGNVRWATLDEQHNNKRTSHFVECDGKRQTIMQWSREKGWPYHVLSDRLRRGMSPEEALSLPFTPRVATTLEFNGEVKTLSQWAIDANVELTVLIGRIKRGWPAAKALRSDYKRVYEKKHGHSNVNGEQSPEYRAWHGMRDCCLRQAARSWPRFGGRGVTVCEAWEDFRVFLRDMGPRPSPKHGLLLAEGASEFGPMTTTWAARSERRPSNKKARLVTFRGETLTIAEWSRRSGLPWATIGQRLDRGMSIEEALTTPSKKSGKGGLAA
jgi:hypothetical protein